MQFLPKKPAHSKYQSNIIAKFGLMFDTKQRKMIVRVFSLVILVLAFHTVNAQEKAKPEYDNAILITPVYTFQIPAAEMTHRFGLSNSVGMAMDYKFGKNWMTGVEGNFMFGRNVKELGMLSNVLASNGMAITRTGELQEIDLGMRGAGFRFNAGKIFNFNNNKPNNGLLVKLGAGFLMHKIIIDAGKDAVPQLSKEYLKGYDRLTQGLMLSQFIGLIKLERGKLVNLYGGIETIQGITKGVRPWDFYRGEKMDNLRFDFLIGVKIGWMIPVFTGESSGNEYYYY